MIYLYLKTHNQTGLKYLGKTTQDPYKYKGSGLHWKSHIKKHGNDVSTEILFQTEDREEFKRVATEYSEKWNIVESTVFANLMPEEGQGGNTGNQWEKGHTPWSKGLVLGPRGPQSEEHIKKRAESRKEWVCVDGIWYKGLEAASKATGVPKGVLTYYKRNHGFDNINTSIYKKYEYAKDLNNIGSVNKIKIKCPHCGKLANAGNLKRWHLDKCKYIDKP